MPVPSEIMQKLVERLKERSDSVAPITPQDILDKVRAMASAAADSQDKPQYKVFFYFGGITKLAFMDPGFRTLRSRWLDRARLNWLRK